MLYIIGKYIFLISYYLVGNKQYIISLYSVYDLTKFTFYISNEIGLVDYVKKKINGDKSEKLILFFENSKCEIINDKLISSEEDDYINITKL